MSNEPSRRGPRVVSREEWRAARIALLAREKELTAMKDTLAAERRVAAVGADRKELYV